MPKYHPDNGPKHWSLSPRKGEREKPSIKSAGKSPPQPSRRYPISKRYGAIYEHSKGTWRVYLDQSRRGKSSSANNQGFVNEIIEIKAVVFDYQKKYRQKSIISLLFWGMYHCDPPTASHRKPEFLRRILQ